MSHSVEEWLARLSNSVPLQLTCPRYIVPFDSHSFIDTFNSMHMHYFNEGYYNDDERWDMVHNYFINSNGGLRIEYMIFLQNTCKYGPVQIQNSTPPPVPKTPVFTDTTTFSYGMMTFTSPNGHFGKDDNKAIEYFDKIYEKYLQPDSQYRNKEKFKANIWLEVKDDEYYHVHMVYRCKKGQWLECNKGTLKKNNIILYNINNKPMRKIRCKDDINHIENWIKYAYNEPGNRVVKQYTVEFDKIC